MRAAPLLSTYILAAAVLGVAACGDSSSPPPPPRMVASAGQNQTANQGTPVAVAPAARVIDAAGNGVAGVAVTFVVAGGGGAVTGSQATSGPDGVAAVGSWVMGPAGPQTLLAQAAGVTDSPVVFSATSVAIVPPEADALEAASLTAQRAQAGHAVGDPPAVRVLDALGRPVPYAPVTFEVVAGGGTLTGAAASSGLDGVARAGSWTLGASGVQQVWASVPGLTGSPVTFEATIRTSTFDITLDFISSATAPQRLAFQRARERIEEVVVGDVPDVVLQLTVADLVPCGGGPAMNQTVDDLLIRVNLAAIDGPGQILGQAGPCFVRTGSDLPALGVMQFDTADLDVLQARGQLEEVVLHEMLHVTGFGYWDAYWPALVTGIGGADPHFTGANALDAFLNYNGGTSYAGQPVPLENSGSVGTRDVHWRESVLKNELMTGYLTGTTQPLSRTTIGSLADIGYQVDLLAADPFDLSTAGLRLARAAAEPVPLEMVDDVLRVPLRTVDPDGTIRPR
jgi:hypothetical protein